MFSANIISSWSRGLRRVVGAAFVYVLAVVLAFAIDEATLTVERVAGEGWIAAGIDVVLDTNAKPMRATVAVAELTVPALQLRLARSQIHCGRFEISEAFYLCDDATIAVTLPELGAQQLRAGFRYDRRTGAIKTDLQGLRIGEGSVNLALTIDTKHQAVEAQLDRVSAQQLAKLAAHLGITVPLELATGNISGTLHAQSRQKKFDAAKFDLKLAEVTANNPSGSIATDKLSGTIAGQVSASTSGFDFRGRVQSQSGQAYFDPIFFDTGVHAIDLQAQGTWQSARDLVATAFTLRHKDVLDASGSARLDLNADQPVRALKVSDAQVQFPGAYDTYLQAIVANDALKSLQTSGAATVSAEISEGVPKKFNLHVTEFGADGPKLLRVQGLNAALNWQATESQSDAVNKDSYVSWRDASVYGLRIGNTHLRFQAEGHAFRLLEPAHVPLLDGGLDVETLRIRNFAQPSVAFLIDATLQPVSVSQLCRAFGWPEFGGHIGGVISKLRMREGVITLGTTLNGQVFDGSVAVSDLRLEQPFSNWPRFYATAKFENLNLEYLTSAFSFGRITGKLSGVIDDLELFNWSPVAFDARFFTPPDDRSKHRISQRAVESIGSLGGGGSSITAALSSGFLRFFSDFNYDRIGLSCRLENDICAMNGIAPAKGGGYYLVKGWGVPRIDVIANSRRVDWPRLVQQLKAATEANAVVVE